MRSTVLALVTLCAACSGGGTADGGSGGSGAGSGGSGGGSSGGSSGGGSGGSGGGSSDGGTDAGTPTTQFTASGGLDASIPTSGPIAAWRTNINASGIQFSTTPSTRLPGIYVGIAATGQLAAGTLDPSTPGFNCAISVSSDAGTWLAAVVEPDAGNSLGQCSVTLTNVTTRFMAVDGISYAVRGSMTATVPFPGGGKPDVSLSASF